MWSWIVKLFVSTPPPPAFFGTAGERNETLRKMQKALKENNPEEGVELLKDFEAHPDKNEIAHQEYVSKYLGDLLIGGYPAIVNEKKEK